MVPIERAVIKRAYPINLYWRWYAYTFLLIDTIEADWEFDDDRIEEKRYDNHTIVSNQSLRYF